MTTTRCTTSAAHRLVLERRSQGLAATIDAHAFVATVADVIRHASARGGEPLASESQRQSEGGRSDVAA